MFEPTPGPWHVDDDGLPIVYDADGWAVAAVTVYRSNRRRSEANARLISAAPDMLAALQAAFEYLDMIPERAAGGCDEAVRIARKARAAIAKATGKQA